MPDHSISSDAMLCDEAANQHFWNNLIALNVNINNNDVQTYLTLTSLQQQMQQSDAMQKAAKQKRLAIKEQAIKLLCPEFFTAAESLKQELIRHLYHPNTPMAMFLRLIKRMRDATCDQLLGELTEPFCRTTYHFVTVMTAHKIIVSKKPAPVYFDQSRAFALLHDLAVVSLMSKINLAEQKADVQIGPAVNFHSLQNYHPLATNKSQEHCQHAFHEALRSKLNDISALMTTLQKEYQRVEDQRPFFLLRPFYHHTMQAIDVWQYELLLQQLKILHRLSFTLKKYRIGLMTWLKELQRTGPINFLLPKKFRNFFIQLVIDKNDQVTKNYHHLLRQLRAKNKHARLQQDLAFLTELAQDIQDNKSQLQSLLQSDLATVEATKLQSPVRVQSVLEEQPYRDAWVVGEKIPEIDLSRFIAKEVQLAEKNLVAQRQWLESVKQKLFEKLSANASTLTDHYCYIKQVLELFLQLKKDSFLTQIKKTLEQLPENNRQHAVIKYCLTQIGLTVAERLDQLQKLAEKTDQAGKLAEAELMRQVESHQLLAYHIQKLLCYAVENRVCTAKQLLEEQAENTQLVTKMVGVQVAQYNAAKLFEKIIWIAQNNHLLNLYSVAEKKLQSFYQQDKFVPESVLPIPTLQQSSVVTMRSVC